MSQKSNKRATEAKAEPATGNQNERIAPPPGPAQPAAATVQIVQAEPRRAAHADHQQQAAFPQVIDLGADATGVGKTTMAWRLIYHYAQHGIATTIVRIETRGVAMPPQKVPTVFIAVEDFALAGRLPGGLAGVVRPMFAAIERAAETGGAVIVDWAGGMAQNRHQILAATGFDERLADLNLLGLSVVVTTNATDRMRQCAHYLSHTAEIAPGLRRALLLNERLGDFDFPDGSEPATAYRELLQAAGRIPRIRMPAIVGESWQICESAGLTMPAVIQSSPAFISQRTGLDRFTATAVITEIAAWWDATQTELDRVFRLPAAA